MSEAGCDCGVHPFAAQSHSVRSVQDTVIIDVRNAYESAIGHFQPPPDGAELLDPKMRTVCCSYLCMTVRPVSHGVGVRLG